MHQEIETNLDAFRELPFRRCPRLPRNSACHYCSFSRVKCSNSAPCSYCIRNGRPKEECELRVETKELVQAALFCKKIREIHNEIDISNEDSRSFWAKKLTHFLFELSELPSAESCHNTYEQIQSEAELNEHYISTGSWPSVRTDQALGPSHQFPLGFVNATAYLGCYPRSYTWSVFSSHTPEQGRHGINSTSMSMDHETAQGQGLRWAGGIPQQDDRQWSSLQPLLQTEDLPIDNTSFPCSSHNGMNVNVSLEAAIGCMSLDENEPHDPGMFYPTMLPDHYERS